MPEFAHIIASLDGITEYIYLHVMGEPLLHPELFEFIKDNCIEMKRTKRKEKRMITTGLSRDVIEGFIDKIEDIICIADCNYQIDYINKSNIEEKYTILSICNGEYYGGGFNIGPKSLLTDGLLDIYYAEKMPKLKMIPLILKLKNF